MEDEIYEWSTVLRRIGADKEPRHGTRAMVEAMLLVHDALRRLEAEGYGADTAEARVMLDIVALSVDGLRDGDSPLTFEDPSSEVDILSVCRSMALARAEYSGFRAAGLAVPALFRGRGLEVVPSHMLRASLWEEE